MGGEDLQVVIWYLSFKKPEVTAPPLLFVNKKVGRHSRDRPTSGIQNTLTLFPVTTPHKISRYSGYDIVVEEQ